MSLRLFSRRPLLLLGAFPAFAAWVLAVGCTSLNDKQGADASGAQDGGRDVLAASGGSKVDATGGAGPATGGGGGAAAGGAGGVKTIGGRGGGGATGGTSTGGGSAGGTGGVAGKPATGGSVTGGAGGKPATGGMATGGVPTGGMATGGLATGGMGTGGMGTGGGTGGLACTSPSMTCNGSCINTQSDANNCGACGHNCLGGTCSSGQCQATMLGRYDRYLGINGISVARDYVYAKGEANLLTRAKKDGTSLSPSFLPTFATSGCTGGEAEQLNGRVFYQWNDGTICRMAVCNSDDCDGSTQAFSPTGGSSYVSTFATDRTSFRVFWYDGSSLRFLMAQATTSGVPTPTTITSGDVAPQSSWLGYAAEAIYFLAGSGSAAMLQRLALTGGSPTNVTAAGTLDAGTLWASATRLYFADQAGTHYVSLPSAAGGKQTITTTIASRLWADDVDLYFRTGSDPTKLQTCKVGNCAATSKVVFTGLCTIEGIRGEADAVYFGNYGQCSPASATPADKMQIWKLAR